MRTSATGILDALVACACLHAEAVVANIDSRVGNKDTLTVGEVNAIAILSIPRAADSNAVNNDVLTLAGVEMETRRVLNGHILDENVLALLEVNQVISEFLLVLGT